MRSDGGRYGGENKGIENKQTGVSFSGRLACGQEKHLQNKNYKGYLTLSASGY